MHSLVERIIKRRVWFRWGSQRCNTLTQKKSTTRYNSLDIISAIKNKNLIQEAIENRKIQGRKQEEIEKFLK